MRSSMEGKVVLITGANSGIGKEAAVALARRGATVLAAARSEPRGRRAVAEIRRRSRRADDAVTWVPLDLARLASVRACAEQVLAEHDRLDVLVNNAGAINPRRRVTEDGFEMTFAVNHLGHFLLTTLLLDRLRATAPARIVTTASIAHRYCRGLSWDDLARRRGYHSYGVYFESKLANVLFTTELARRLAGTGVTANCLHPGLVRSGWAAGTPGIEGLILTAGRPFLVSPRRGAAPIVELASSPRYAGASGGYYVGGYLSRCSRRRPSAAGRDEAAARRLWAVSDQLLAGAGV